jgi:hypothetical protein
MASSVRVSSTVTSGKALITSAQLNLLSSANTISLYLERFNSSLISVINFDLVVPNFALGATKKGVKLNFSRASNASS